MNKRFVLYPIFITLTTSIIIYFFTAQYFTSVDKQNQKNNILLELEHKKSYVNKFIKDIQKHQMILLKDRMNITQKDLEFFSSFNEYILEISYIDINGIEKIKLDRYNSYDEMKVYDERLLSNISRSEDFKEASNNNVNYFYFDENLNLVSILPIYDNKNKFNAIIREVYSTKDLFININHSLLYNIQVLPKNEESKIIKEAILVSDTLSLFLRNSPIITVWPININHHISNFQVMYIVLVLTIIFLVGLFSYFYFKDPRHGVALKGEIKSDNILKERLASIGEIVSDISHQFKQPLNIIMILSSEIKFLVDSNANTDKKIIKDNIKKIQSSIEEMNYSVETFRELLIERKKIQIFGLKKELKALVKLHQTLKNNSVKVLFEIDDDIRVENYKNFLLQSVLNIINNANDELIKIPKENRFLLFKASKEDKNILLEIIDSAGGIPKKIINEVFDSKISTKLNANGTGLGLNITKKFINEEMKSDIKVENIVYNFNNKDYNCACFKIELANLKG